MASSHELRSKPGSNFKEGYAQKQKETNYKELLINSYEPEGSSARSVEETKVTPIDKAKRVFRVALNVPKEFRKRE
ncbi:hypothetical protein YC2023_005677 [Brassica napus]